MIQHNSVHTQRASGPRNKFNILLRKISKSPAKRSMDQLCNANTRNKARGGISGVYHHYTQQCPSKWNEFQESIHCLPLGERGQTALKRPWQASQDGWFTRRPVPALIDQAGSLARGALISHADAACVSALCNIKAQFLPFLGPQEMRFALQETVNSKSNHRINY